jgi:hypothetical protein
MRYRLVADAMHGMAPDGDSVAERLGALLVNRQ